MGTQQHYFPDNQSTAGFDCDDFASALSAFLQNNLTIQGTKFQFLNIQYLSILGFAESGHAMNLVTFGGTQHVLDAQSGILIPITGSTTIESAVEQIMLSIYGHEPDHYSYVTNVVENEYETTPPWFTSQEMLNHFESWLKQLPDAHAMLRNAEEYYRVTPRFSPMNPQLPPPNLIP